MRRFDIIIIGSGSGNTILSEAYEGLDVALIDGGDTVAVRLHGAVDPLIYGDGRYARL